MKRKPEANRYGILCNANNMSGWEVPQSRIQPALRDEELRQQIENSEFAPSSAGLWWLTQASWVVKFNSLTIAIDPWWRDLFAGDVWGKLLGEYPLKPEGFPRLDYVFCTHWHDDHLCPESLPRLASTFPETKFIVPSRSLDQLTDWGIDVERIIPTNGHRTQSIGGLTFKAIPAAHMELDFDEEGDSWYVGYVIECDGVTIYHMGDGQPWPGWHTSIEKAATALGDGLDIALLCINGNDNLSHIQAVDLIEKIEPKAAIPMHYGMDPHNTVSPQIYVDELSARLPEYPCMVAEHGRGLRFADDSLQVI
ncbi:MAG: MBL fold metallo-hydrolase [Candidatus Poseidoniaceae archaeon]|nr:MBL fold metallo-hydrolase [Candidatus Poseidoniaceae archaeon]